ncbi:MAG: hypothetical protein GC183_15190 [Thiobacillus sp.]|nr:hypothetical protein [Thiobacillus sp.]
MLAIAMLSALPALAQDATGEWRKSVYLYGMGVAIDGEAQIGPLSVPVDVSISDMFDALDFGAMAAYRIENGTWSFSADVTYMDLGFSETTQQRRASVSLDTDQLTIMGTVGRRVSPRLEALFSLAYFDLSTQLDVRVLQQQVSASRDVDWVDPLLGLNYRAPFGDKWNLDLRGDVGGFGVGSDLTLHGWVKLVHQNSESFSWYFGYRYIGYDYETGSGINYQRYDLAQHGPGIGVAWSF